MNVAPNFLLCNHKPITFPWHFFIEKLEIEKVKRTIVKTTYKTKRNTVGLIFSVASFFTNKNAQGRKFVHEKKVLN